MAHSLRVSVHCGRGDVREEGGSDGGGQKHAGMPAVVPEMHLAILPGSCQAREVHKTIMGPGRWPGW